MVSKHLPFLFPVNNPNTPTSITIAFIDDLLKVTFQKPGLTSDGGQLGAILYRSASLVTCMNILPPVSNTHLLPRAAG